MYVCQQMWQELRKMNNDTPANFPTDLVLDTLLISYTHQW